MRFQIPRVSPSIDPEVFLRLCYEPRLPVLIQGAAKPWPATRRWTRAYLEEQLERSAGRATRQLFWWDIDNSLLSEDVPQPPLIECIRKLQKPSERARSRRLWMSRAGDRTPWHYDGNSVEVFNAQIVGRKRFTLVSPETPIETDPFSIFGSSPDANPEDLLTERHVFTTFILEAGDLLFLPRHWFHFVESLDAFNANINWIWTDLRSGSLNTPVGQREQDLVAALYPLFAVESAIADATGGLSLPGLKLQHFNRDYAREYGGEPNFRVSRSFLRERGWSKALRTVTRELAAGLRSTSNTTE